MSALVTVTLPSSTGMAEDGIVNQFALVGDPGEYDTDFELLRTAFANFYNAVPSGASVNVASLLSPVLSRTTLASVVKLYDIEGHLSGTPHGSPIAEGGFTLAAAGAGTPLPSEVALVFTLETASRAASPVEVADSGDSGTARDRPKMRHTGRIYLGPLGSITTRVVSGVCRPTDNATDVPRLAFSVLQTAIEGIAAGGSLGVWSRKDAIVRPAAFVSCDDAFDTQRRRGEGPKNRYRMAL